MNAREEAGRMMAERTTTGGGGAATFFVQLHILYSDMAIVYLPRAHTTCNSMKHIGRDRSVMEASSGAFFV
jgi:hypothetical protein